MRWILTTAQATQPDAEVIAIQNKTADERESTQMKFEESAKKLPVFYPRLSAFIGGFNWSANGVAAGPYCPPIFEITRSMIRYSWASAADMK